MNEERVWYLLSAQLSGEATPHETEELNTLLQQQPELGWRIELMRNVWKSRQQQLPATDRPYDKHLQRLSNQLAQPALQYETDATAAPIIPLPALRSRRRWLWPAMGAAVAILVVFVVFMPGAKKQTKPLADNTISTRPGSKTKVELPDGTQVWLNADSKLTYGQQFMGNTREVNLAGEAYFDVAHAVSPETGQRIPFIIHTPAIEIKVLGTAFNVRSYPGEKTTETALIRGSVEVTPHNRPDKKIMLKPDEKLIVQNDEAIVRKDAETQDRAMRREEPLMTVSRIHPYKKDTTAHYETMWVKNKLAFENEALERLLPELERWYNVTIVCKNESLQQLHFTGIFENKPLADVLEALSLSSGFHYKIKGADVSIW